MITRQQIQQTGVLIGGSGLIGGTLTHYFKTFDGGRTNLLAPNSKKLSIRDPEDIRDYFEKIKPAFIINCAIAAIDSDPQLSYEISYLGTVLLARVAAELGIPYIHISSAAVMPAGSDLDEDARLPLTPELANYPKAKLMSELSLEHLQKTRGLDYTILRLAIVYGSHDHKIQGFHRLLFSVVSQAMPLLFTSPDALHSYSNARKLPHCIAHILARRAEFSGRTYNFVDKNPVSLSQLILTIKSYLELKSPREIYIPQPLAHFGISPIRRLVRLITRFGIEARMPAELMFLEKFYQTQTLSASRLRQSSFVDPDPEATIFTELPSLIQYYVTRWEQLNLIEPFNREFFDPRKRAEDFLDDPARLLADTHKESEAPFLRQCPLTSATPYGRRRTDA